MSFVPPDPVGPTQARRRRLRAVFAADVANFGNMVSVDETRTLNALWETRKIGREELEAHGGWLFGMPGDGLFALFESAIDAVHCALVIQTRLADTPELRSIQLRIGVHLGEVLFEGGLPFGETVVIAARLESLADPAGILISSSVMDAVAPRISATFEDRGVRSLKHSPRRIATFSVTPPPAHAEFDGTTVYDLQLDRTTRFRRPVTGGSGTAKASPALGAPETPRGPIATAPATILSGPEKIPETAADEVSRRPGSQIHPVEAGILADTPAIGRAIGDVEPVTRETILADLAQALIVHLGPIASFLIRSHAKDEPSISRVVELVADEIPAESERTAFLLRARRIASNLNH